MGDVLTEAADWYSFGVVLYEALTGELPLRRPSSTRLQGAPAGAREPLPSSSGDTPRRDRPSAAEVLATLGGDADRPRSLRDPSSALPAAVAVRANGRARRAARRARPHRARGGVPGSRARAFGHRKDGARRALRRARARRGCAGWSASAGSASRWDTRPSTVSSTTSSRSSKVARTTKPSALLPVGCGPRCHRVSGALSASALGRAAERQLGTVDHTVVRPACRGGVPGAAPRDSAGAAAVVVWIDDLQWSDRRERAAARARLRNADPVPFLLVGTYRRRRGSRRRRSSTRSSTTRPSRSRTPSSCRSRRSTSATRSSLALELCSPRRTSAAARRSHRRSGARRGSSALHRRARPRRGLAAAASIGGPRPSIAPPSRGGSGRRPAGRPDLLESTAVAGTPLSRGVLRQTRHRPRRGRRRRSTCSARTDSCAAPGCARTTRSTSITTASAGSSSRDPRRGQEEPPRSLARVLGRRPATPSPSLLAVHHLGVRRCCRARDGTPARRRASTCALCASSHAADLYERVLRDPTSTRHERRAVQVRRAEALALRGAAAPLRRRCYLATVAATSDRGQALELRRLGAEQLLLSGHLGHGLHVIGGVLDESLGMHESRGGRRALLVAIAAGRLALHARGLRHVVRTESIGSPARSSCAARCVVDLSCSLSLVDPVRGAAFQTPAPAPRALGRRAPTRAPEP